MKNKNSLLAGTFAVILVSGLTGCESMKDKLGISRHAPDEFAVMQRAPLVVPQDLSALPAPNPGAPRPMETPATAQAKAAILGETPDDGFAGVSSNAESSLLQRAGATQTQNGIRATVNREAKEEVEDKRPVIKRLIGSDGEKPATVVDAANEAKRIQDAKKAGQPITTGQTPTIQQ